MILMSLKKNLSKFIGFDIIYNEQLSDKNKFYFERWQGEYFNSFKYFFKELEKRYLISKYEKIINSFGYSLCDLNKNNMINTYNHNIDYKNDKTQAFLAFSSFYDKVTPH